jgi:HSP20 family protein
MAWISDEDINKMFERLLKQMGFNNTSDPMVKSWSYGYSMRMGPDGQPIINEWGTELPERSNPFIQQEYLPEHQDPLYQIDVNKENKTVRIIVEMPGFTKDNIHITGTENNLKLTATNGTRQLDTDIPIKAKVDPNTAKATYKNGVLDITLTLMEIPESDEVNIQVN